MAPARGRRGTVDGTAAGGGKFAQSESRPSRHAVIARPIRRRKSAAHPVTPSEQPDHEANRPPSQVALGYDRIKA
jgi:hypothetical protein